MGRRGVCPYLFLIKLNLMRKAAFTTIRDIVVFSLIALTLSCSSAEDGTDTPDEPTTENEAYPEAWHDKMRTRPYPQSDNQLVINPSPLIVPQGMKTDDYLQFELSQDPDFASSSVVIRSGKQPWCMFNPHQTLADGTWYWRYRQVSKDGSEQEWSKNYEFKVDASVDKFVTPTFETFRSHAVPQYPRLYCFLDEGLQKARKQVTTLSEYKPMTSRAKEALTVDVEADVNYKNAANEGTILNGTKTNLKGNVGNLYTAYALTQDEQYADKMLQILRKLISLPLSDNVLFESNFASTNIALCLIPVYDALHASLSSSDRQQVEEIMMRLLRYYYPRQITYEENHIFDNHFWQQNMRVLMQCTFLLYDNPTYSSEVLPMLEYYYELWTARAPSMGYNRDGGWQNGTKYFINNTETLFYVPMLFGYMTGSSFLGHPWYHNAGEAIVYTWPPQSNSLGFGDGWEWYGSAPQRQRVAYADFLARELGDAYAGWYAKQQASTLKNDLELCLYRMANFEKDGYLGTLPANHPKLKWMEDMGEVMMHSDIDDISNDFALSFRSSTFGSGSHTLADQNSFNVLYKGDYVYCSTGYYQEFDDKHNLLSYRHTRAHNTILVNGIGQPFSTKGYGDVTRAMGGDHIGYCLGDASHAYSGISDDDMWIEAFRKAGISQTAQYGFGATPLKKYRRHVLMLYPDIVVIYDELEASEAVTWDWLLHGLTAFDIDNADNSVITENTNKGFVAQTRLFSDDAMALSRTNKFFADPSSGITEKYPAQWHLTARINGKPATRVLAIMQVGESRAALMPVSRNGNTFKIGDWTIEAVMQASSRAALTITNSALNGISFTYDASTNSTLHDTVSGVQQTQTQTDRTPIKTRLGRWH